MAFNIYDYLNQAYPQGLLSNQLTNQQTFMPKNTINNPNSQVYGPQEMQGPPTIDQYYNQILPDMSQDNGNLLDYQPQDLQTQDTLPNSQSVPQPQGLLQQTQQPQGFWDKIWNGSNSQPVNNNYTSEDLQKSLLSDYMKTNSAKGGLLGFLQNPGTMGLAQGLLSAGKWSATPINNSEALATGIAGMQKAQTEAAKEGPELLKTLSQAKFYGMGGRGGNSVFAQVMAQIEADPELSKLPAAQKIAIAQSKVGTNLIVDPMTGQIVDMGGAATGLQNLATGKEQGVKNVDLAMNPKIAGATDTAQKQAEAITQAQIDLPKTIDQSNIQISQLSNLLKSPGLDSNFGLTGKVPNRPGSEAADAAAMLEQVKGGGFLSAYQLLRGAGQISNVEGDKATTAYIRMQTAQSASAFREAATEYKDIIEKGLKRVQNLASGKTFNQQSPAPQTSSGTTYQKFNLPH